MRSVNFIEFVGLPGLGKSTLIRNLVEESTGEQVFQQVAVNDRLGSVRGYIKTTFDIVLFFASQGRIILPFFIKCITSRSLWRRFIKLAVQYRVEKITVSTGELALADQWFIQEVWGLMLDTQDSTSAQKALWELLRNYLRKPIHIVWLDGDPDLAAFRIWGRTGGASRYDRIASVEDITDMMRQDQKYLELIYKVLLSESVKLEKIDPRVSVKLNSVRLRKRFFN